MNGCPEIGIRNDDIIAPYFSASVDFNHTYDAWRSRTEESQKKSKALLAKYDEKLAQHKVGS